MKESEKHGYRKAHSKCRKQREFKEIKSLTRNSQTHLLLETSAGTVT